MYVWCPILTSSNIKTPRLTYPNITVTIKYCTKVVPETCLDYLIFRQKKMLYFK